jgi:hypothetical protein
MSNAWIVTNLVNGEQFTFADAREAFERAVAIGQQVVREMGPKAPTMVVQIDTPE